MHLLEFYSLSDKHLQETPVESETYAVCGFHIQSVAAYGPSRCSIRVETEHLTSRFPERSPVHGDIALEALTQDVSVPYPVTALSSGFA